MPEPEPRSAPGSGRVGVLLRAAVAGLWLVLVLAGFAATVLPWVPVPFPAWAPSAGAATVTTLFAFGLAARAGGRPVLAGALALALAAAAVVSTAPVLLCGAAVSTAVLGAVLGVMATKPSAGFVGVVREVLVAVLVAVVASFAVEAYGAPLSPTRTGYLVLGLSLLGAVGLVYRLGAGLHGLGRRGALTVVGGIVLLFVCLAYTEAIAAYGPPGLVHVLETSTARVHAAIGAVPRPTEVLLGVPALAWGISTRARRRQGWWVCAFGAAGLAVVAVTLLNPLLPLDEAGLTLLYSTVLGLLLGYLVIRADLFLTGARGRRARLAEEASAHRPEPGRMQPLS
ncbi:MAG: hypothetical protein ACXVEU_19130 [Nocardioidaceae bacterium]